MIGDNWRSYPIHKYKELSGKHKHGESCGTMTRRLEINLKKKTLQLLSLFFALLQFIEDKLVMPAFLQLLQVG